MHWVPTVCQTLKKLSQMGQAYPWEGWQALGMRQTPTRLPPPQNPGSAEQDRARALMIGSQPQGSFCALAAIPSFATNGPGCSPLTPCGEGRRGGHGLPAPSHGGGGGQSLQMQRGQVSKGRGAQQHPVSMAELWGHCCPRTPCCLAGRGGDSYKQLRGKTHRIVRATEVARCTDIK
jgi:hypothetical protein